MSRIELGWAGRAVAANVRHLRGRRGLSLRALSEALERQGRHLGEDALGKIENGAKGNAGRSSRRVDADDLAALAAVLGVEPGDLLRPLEEGRQAQAAGSSPKAARRDG